MIKDIYKISMSLTQLNVQIRLAVEALHDIQTARIRHSNRVGAYKRLTGLDYPREADIVAPPLEVAEREMVEKVEKLVKDHPLWEEFGSQVKGLGPILLAKVMAEVITFEGRGIDRFDNVSKLWKYFGLAPGQRARRGEKAGYRRRAKSVAWLVARNILMAQGPGGKRAREPGEWYKLYEQYRQQEERKNEEGIRLAPQDCAGFILAEDIGKFGAGTMIRKTEALGRKGKGGNFAEFLGECEKVGAKSVRVKLTDKHMHTRAVRKLMKRFLALFWVAWRKVEGLPVTKPCVHRKEKPS